MRELNVTQGSQEWLAARAKCFTASDAPAIMGVSKYKTRTELLREKATGIAPEIDAATQARFDAGHAAEAAARPLAEAIIGEELFPVTATTDDGKYLASSDGATMLYDTGFEHKLFNAQLVESVKAGIVPESHKWQLVHQAMVFGFKRIMFCVSDGTEENFHYCWFSATKEDIDRLIAGWDQFDEDLKNYQHIDPEKKLDGVAPDALPALRVEVTGMVTYSNLDEFKAKALSVIGGIKTELITDQDFVDADKTAKWLGDVEDKLNDAKKRALEQTDSIDRLFSAIDEIAAQAASTRIKLEKLVKSEKENRKTALVMETNEAFRKHVEGLMARTNNLMPSQASVFGDAIKGLKSLDSMRDKLATALANAKIASNEIADLITSNVALLDTAEKRALFPDLKAVCTKPADDFKAILAGRDAQRREAEERRLEAERQRIRAEEQAKAQREAAEKAAAEKREADANAAAEQAERNAQIAAQQRTLDEAEDKAIVAEPNQRPEASSTQQGTAVTPLAGNQEAAQQAFSGKTMNLGQINAALGFTVSADFLASLGMLPVRQEKAAKLYDANKLPTICRLIQEHLTKVMKQNFRIAA